MLVRLYEKPETDAYAMGQFFEQDTFSQQDGLIFQQRLQAQLASLRELLATPGFSGGEQSIGAELEMYLVDSSCMPAAKNRALIGMSGNPQLTEELCQFNLEFNLSPVSATGNPFGKMEKELREVMDALQHQADDIDTHIIPIGILPTLQSNHLNREFMTDLPRYRALTRQLARLNGEPFLVDINGEDSLRTQCDEVTVEGANTSFQVHLKVPAERFKDLFNAAQLTTPVVLALAGNSPTFLGKRLWQETRIALFKQSIDSRIRSLTQWRQPARVTFGQGWLREGAWEAFAENVALYPAILPCVSPDNTPYAELCMHHGTVWSWNRAVFEPKHGGHLRIEFRALPAGPTVTDMMANAALSIGLTMAVAENIDEYLVKLPFQYAEYNFYRAAQKGLDASLLWPQPNQHHLTEVPVRKIIASLMPMAQRGLSMLCVDAAESDRLLSVIEERLSSGRTGSKWQLDKLAGYQASYDNEQALVFMLKDYLANLHEGQPVAQWQ